MPKRVSVQATKADADHGRKGLVSNVIDDAKNKPATGKNTKLGSQPEIFAKSIRRLARHLGRSDTAVRKWMKREDWPFPRTPPWDIKQVQAWAEINLRPDPGKAYQQKLASLRNGSGAYGEIGALTRAKIQVTLERAMWIRQRRLVEAGKLIDAEEAQRYRLRQIQAAKSLLVTLPRSVANALVGQDRNAIEQILNKRIEELLDEFADSTR